MKAIPSTERNYKDFIYVDRVIFVTPKYDPNPNKSKTNNHKWRKCLIIEFRDRKGNLYSWMPTNIEVNDMVIAKAEVEEINKELLRNNGARRNTTSTENEQRTLV